MAQPLSLDLENKDVAGYRSLVSLLRQRACQQPDSPVYTPLIDGEQEGGTLNYFEVDLQARAIGAALQALGASRERVLLVFPPGIDFVLAFYGCLYAGAIAVPTQAPVNRSKHNQSLTRFQAILRDASPLAVLTTSAMLPKLKSLAENIQAPGETHWIATDEIPAHEAEHWRDLEVDADDLALLQYTSGSTASPKGVMVSNRNLLANSEYIDHGFEHTSQSVSLSWLPHSHDMGLINGIIQPLYKGFRCLMMSPAAFIQSPYRWLKAISQYRVTHSGGPNFAYELCLRKITAEQRASLDLSSWAVAFNGAEPVRKQTMEDFAEAFAPCGFRLSAFYPAYGLAEATLKVTGGRRDDAPVFITLDAEALEKNRVIERSAGAIKGRSIVGAGKAACETKVVVVHPETGACCGPDEIGEIWVSGPGVARGYWNRQEETDKVFRAFLKDTGEGPFLRTGDIGFERNGELFITGRIKDLIIIRGVNHYPQDIELSVERCHTALRPGAAAAFPIDVDGREQLVVAQELDFRQQPDPDDVMDSIRRAVAENHEVQLHAIALLKPGTLPKTTSGKIQRRLCRSLFLEGSLDAIAIWQAPAVENSDAGLTQTISFATEESITDWLRSLLASKMGIAASSIDFARPITRYGLDSLVAIELMHAIQSTFGIVLSLSDFLESPSISQLATRLKDRLESGAALPNISTEAQDGDSPLSAGQQSLWFMHQIAPQSTAYNIAVPVRIASEVDIEALRLAFQALTDRHAMLRTTFSASYGEPFQRVHKNSQVHFEAEDASRWTEAQQKERLAEEVNGVFDLEKGPLFRVKLFSRSSQEHVLLLVVHHIVADLWSLAVLLQELGPLYSAKKSGEQPSLEPLRCQYVDYVRWETERLAGPEGDRLSAYWQKQLSGAATILDLPFDRPRPRFQSFKGASLFFGISSELTDRIKQVGLEQDATLYVTLLAAFQVLLYRYTGQTDFVVGSPTSGRSRMEAAQIVGYFVNPLVMRAGVSGAESFNRILSRARQTVIDALDHENYPFPLLVKQLQPERDASRSPVFQVLFVLQKSQLLVEENLAHFLMGSEGSCMKLGELSLESMLLEKKVAQFDLSLSMTEIGGEMLGSLEYNTDLFDEATIRRMAEQFQTLIQSLIADPDRPVSRLEMLTEAERQLLLRWVDTSVDYGESEILPELFEHQVNRTPRERAVAFEEQELTYDELNRRANKLAHWLKGQGVGPDVLVGVMIERSIEMVVGLLGILKAGGAYVPLDPHHPQERLAFMLSDAQAKIILTQQRFADRVASSGVKVISLDADWQMLSDESERNPETSAIADGLAYVIYTSGSTGKPKGAMNTHRAITNRLCWMQAAYGLDASDRVLQKTPFTFDVSVWEFFWPLMTGASLVLARPGGHQDSTYLINLISRHEITTLHFVPSMLHAFLDNSRASNCRSIRRVICSGEALSSDLQRRFFARLDSALHNLYGPTEAAVDVTFWACEQESDRVRVPIGHPIANIQVHILDAQMQPVPIGVAGELHIAGEGLARGYLNRADLTGERFIPNPFSIKRGARMYRTGDLARYLAGGEIEFLGRIDHQVKVRGFRIEPGEIESALAAHTAIREAVVTAIEHGPGDIRLTAYIVPTPEHMAYLQSPSDSAGESSTSMSKYAPAQSTGRHKLPNGLLIAHDGEIQFNTMDIYREVFEKEVYLKHGVTLSDGDCIFDVGAHIGLFTIFATQKCRDARIYAFEPIPPTFEVLKANVSIPGHNIKLFNFGLADRASVDSFHYYPRMTGVSGRIADPEEHKKRRKPILFNWLRSVTGGQPTTMLSEQDINDILEQYFTSETYECRLKTLSDVIRENDVERIDLLKIDVEESELDVLAGIREGDWARIKQVVIEVESKPNLDLVASLLKKHDYDVFVDSVDYGVSSEDAVEQDSPASEVGAYMIYGLRRGGSKAQPANEPIESSFRVFAAPQDSVLAVDNLRNHLLAKLPDYMVPSAFVLLDSLPLLSNGKVNLNALPAPGFSRQQLEQDYVAPRNEAEQALAKIFADVLGLEKVGVEDNFFKLGGHSLLATQAMSRIIDKFKVELPLQRLFEQPTVAGFAGVITNAEGFRLEGIDPITRVNQSVEEMLLAKLDELSDEEVEALLRDAPDEDRRGE
jgi:amino acid adenylation domain-containing protein/FkbM family methyltransferase